jgi:hypothetical protein
MRKLLSVLLVLAGGVTAVGANVAWVALRWLERSPTGPLAMGGTGDEAVNWLVRPTSGVDEPELAAASG